MLQTVSRQHQTKCEDRTHLEALQHHCQARTHAVHRTTLRTKRNSKRSYEYSSRRRATCLRTLEEDSLTIRPSCQHLYVLTSYEKPLPLTSRSKINRGESGPVTTRLTLPDCAVRMSYGKKMRRKEGEARFRHERLALECFKDMSMM